MDTEALVLDWGGLALATDRINTVEIDLDNGLDASSHAALIGERLSYLEELHNLTHAPVTISEAFPAVTTQAAFEALLAARADAPARVLLIEGVTDLVSGGTQDYYWSDRVVENLGTLYRRPLFTGHIDAWSYTLNRFRLHLSGSERAEHKSIPEKTVTLAAWPNSRFDQEGQVYPEIWGSPGTPLDANKIGDGAGAVPAVLVDRVALKYAAAGHALTSIGGATSGAIAVWAKVPGLETALGYIEDCTLALSATDGEGNVVATVTLPKDAKLSCFLPGAAVGTKFTNTAANPANACGRDASDFASVENGEILEIAIGDSIDQGTEIFRVWIAIGGAHADLRARWVGAQATIEATAAGYVRIEDFGGWSASGKVQLAGGLYDYQTITRVDDDTIQLNISGYAGADTGNATEVGAWVTMSAANVEVTDQRNWDETIFSLLEIELENTHASADHDVTYLGLRVLMAPPSYPEVLVDCAGAAVTYLGAAYGATQNAALIIEDLHTRVLGLAESRIGSTFASVIGLLAAWKLDVALLRQVRSDEFLRRLADQAKAFLWRDGENDVQIGIYRLGDASTVTLDSAADIVDADGAGFEVGYTAPEEIFSRVYLNWSPAGWRDAYLRQFFITEDESSPADSGREAGAAASQAAFRVTNTMTVDAPDVQDEATALDLLQFLFDFHSTRRKTLAFQVPLHVQIEPGTVILVTHPLLTASENFLVRAVTREGNRAAVDAIALGLEAQLEDLAVLELNASADNAGDLWGSPGFFDPFGGGGSQGTRAATEGRVVDYGLSLWANRLFADTAEKPTHGGVGSGASALDPAQLALIAPQQSRVTFDGGYPSRSGGTVTWRFRVTALGAGYTLRECGIFSAATGNKLLGRVLFASGLTIAQDETVVITLTIEVRRPEDAPAASTTRGLTDYGADLYTQRLYQDTAEKPTHLAIGTSAQAEAGGDLALAAQISTRSAFASGYPLHGGLSVHFNAIFAAATHGNNTVRELGLFSHASNATCIVRKILPDPVTLGVTDSFTASHRLTAGNE